ncbi:TIGR01841 family phasin [Paraburkholderia sp. MMS20-SJTR3]|uniref:TIGR01841 family phasin n=1 Tax=Paraburkholderia sejongensis TaxID=2886946 RepID=A0ABS8JRF8_9BURK|nr:TIGR01841 family phasin [Paraburkholderia sp. MMS20-SJTR3]MCC8392412.1 TIGR01841 family phasin [Paraburkholderia sp. MMS20-SJTR3]
MISTTPQHLAAAQKAGVDTTFEILNKTAGALEKLIALNLQTANAALADQQQRAHDALAANAPQTIFAQQAGRSQPMLEKTQSYWREVHEIAAGTRADFLALAQARLSAYRSDAQRYFDNLAKQAPACSETAVAGWKAFIGALGDTTERASAAYDTVTKAVTQAQETAADDLAASAASAVKRTRQLAAPADTAGK